MPLPLLLAGLWRWRGRLLAAMAALWAAGAAAVLLAPRAHVAQAVVAPAETTSFAVSSLLAPTPFAPGGLLDTRPTGNFAVYLGALRSPEAARMLAGQTRIAEALTAERRAGPGAALRALLGADREADADDVLAWLTRNLAVTPSLASVTWTIEIAHADPALALAVLQRLHGFAEAKVRADLADQAARRVAALERRIARESDVFLRNSLYELLAQQQRAGLVVAADEAVAARLVSAPMVEARPSLPNRPLLLALLAVAVPLAVLLAAAAWLLARHDPVRMVAAAAEAPAPSRPRREPALAAAGPPERPPPPVAPPPGRAP
ncbi:uncharacterized protein involved in exopolysaccharide biosynthesis [Roseomonas alkaliterrae]|uniref:Uncharacterized protein involved in exopolysaccharide biosynthesis n=2 Tax=Neoroseomonas alkaliterrae TaxID=1452450 RepID=A0A840XNB3_9PROT|nr:hypothetical protein [Neoroseomonas alkaliterrae]MBB5688219.1 uncharacterized protein involved in exopolysaccharide biosynthesis [Neoroseomonas alkaliterrae]